MHYTIRQTILLQPMCFTFWDACFCRDREVGLDVANMLARTLSLTLHKLKGADANNAKFLQIRFAFVLFLQPGTTCIGLLLGCRSSATTRLLT